MYVVTKHCNTCKDRLPLTTFSRSRHARDGLQGKCRACQRIYATRYVEYRRAYRHRNPNKAHRKWMLKREYGLTQELYERMLLGQGGGCAICHTTEPGTAKNYFSVDHCHVTGKIRGLLCNRCNRALGLFRDDAAVLAAAIDYLNRNG